MAENRGRRCLRVVRSDGWGVDRQPYHLDVAQKRLMSGRRNEWDVKRISDESDQNEIWQRDLKTKKMITLFSRDDLLDGSRHFFRWKLKTTNDALLNDYAMCAQMCTRTHRGKFTITLQSSNSNHYSQQRGFGCCHDVTFALRVRLRLSVFSSWMMKEPWEDAVIILSTHGNDLHKTVQGVLSASKEDEQRHRNKGLWDAVWDGGWSLIEHLGLWAVSHVTTNLIRVLLLHHHHHHPPPHQLYVSLFSPCFDVSYHNAH